MSSSDAAKLSLPSLHHPDTNLDWPHLHQAVSLKQADLACKQRLSDVDFTELRVLVKGP